MTVMDWVNDGGRDEPLSPGDNRVLALLVLGIIGRGAVLGVVLYLLL